MEFLLTVPVRFGDWIAIHCGEADSARLRAFAAAQHLCAVRHILGRGDRGPQQDHRGQKCRVPFQQKVSLGPGAI